MDMHGALRGKLLWHCFLLQMYLISNSGPAHFFVVAVGRRGAVVVDPLGTAAANKIVRTLLRPDVTAAFPVLLKCSCNWFCCWRLGTGTILIETPVLANTENIFSSCNSPKRCVPRACLQKFFVTTQCSVLQV
jgi:hypothetical protein